jgi:hypothetical protein
MNDRNQAQVLSRYLDVLLQDLNGAAVVFAPQIPAWSEWVRTLAILRFHPRPGHLAAVERLLQVHRAVLHSANAAIARGLAQSMRSAGQQGLIGGLSRWLLALLVATSIAVGLARSKVIREFFVQDQSDSTPALATPKMSGELPVRATTTHSASPPASVYAVTPSLTQSTTATLPGLTSVPARPTKTSTSNQSRVPRTRQPNTRDAPGSTSEPIRGLPATATVAVTVAHTGTAGPTSRPTREPIYTAEPTSTSAPTPTLTAEPTPTFLRTAPTPIDDNDRGGGDGRDDDDDDHGGRGGGRGDDDEDNDDDDHGGRGGGRGDDDEDNDDDEDDDEDGRRRRRRQR